VTAVTDSRTAGDNHQRDSDPAGIRLRHLPSIPPAGVLSTIGRAFPFAARGHPSCPRTSTRRHRTSDPYRPPGGSDHAAASWPAPPGWAAPGRDSAVPASQHPSGAFLPDIVVPDPRFACRRHTNGNGSHLEFRPKGEHSP